MESERLNRQIAFSMECDRMKSIYRQTLLADGSRRETDAEHSWHIALLATLLQEYAPADCSRSHTVELCLVHDLVEIDAGDTFAYDEKGYEDKAERETKAADRLFSMLPADQAEQYRSWWEEFEACQTPDARFANCCDRIQPLLNNMATQGYSWKQHDVHRAQVEKRIAMLQSAAPALWKFCEELLDKAIQCSWLKP